jgi:Flp pilus assembly pilin Flp
MVSMVTFDFRRVRRAESGSVSIEYALLGAVVALGIVAALINTKGSLNTEVKQISKSIYTSQLPSPSWTTSTLTGSQPGSLLGYAATTKTYTNNDGTTRTVTTINDPAQAAAAVYSSVDITYDAAGKMTYRSYAINKGDYGTPGMIADTNFNYTGPNTYTYTENSYSPDTWAWLSHNDSIVNGNLSSQMVYNKDGGVYQSNFAPDSYGVNRLNNVVVYNAAGGVANTTYYTYDSAGNVTSTVTK